MIKRILVPLDGSDVAEGALPYAQEIAARTGAQILLLAAVHQIDPWPTYPVQVDPKKIPLVEAYLEEKSKELKAKGLAVKTEAVEGTPADVILARAANENEDLVIMSSHGHSGVKRWVLGSVTEKVVHASRCPVLIVQPYQKPRWSVETPVLKKILVPLDCSEPSLAVLPLVKELARPFDASLVLLTVLVPLYMPTVGDFISDLAESADHVLEEVVKEMETSGVKASKMTVWGLGVDDIIRVAEESKTDLIALSTHGASGLARWAIGSVAEGVLHRAPVPCLIIRPPGMDKPA
jgi:nucleotide-binding universal stress UspA family protein